MGTNGVTRSSTVGTCGLQFHPLLIYADPTGDDFAFVAKAAVAKWARDYIRVDVSWNFHIYRFNAYPNFDNRKFQSCLVLYSQATILLDMPTIFTLTQLLTRLFGTGRSRESQSLILDTRHTLALFEYILVIQKNFLDMA